MSVWRCITAACSGVGRDDCCGRRKRDRIPISGETTTISLKSGPSVEGRVPPTDSAQPLEDGKRADLTRALSLKLDATLAADFRQEDHAEVIGSGAGINATVTAVVEGAACAEQAYFTVSACEFQAAEASDTGSGGVQATQSFFPQPSMLFTPDEPGPKIRVTAKAGDSRSPWSRRAHRSEEAQRAGTTAERLKLTELVAGFELEPTEEVS